MNENYHHRRAQVQATSLISLGIIIAIVVLLGLFFRPGSTSTSQDVTAGLATAQAQVLQTAEQQRHAVAEAQIKALLNQGDEAIASLNGLDQELQRWQRDVLGLLSSPEGNIIAADDERAKQFSALLDTAKPPAAEFPARQRKLLDTLLEPLRRAMKNPGAVAKPDESIGMQIQQIKNDADEHLQRMQTARKAVQGMLSEAERTGDQPAEVSLHDRLAEIEERYARLRAIELAEAREQVEKENREKLVEVETSQTHRVSRGGTETARGRTRSPAADGGNDGTACQGQG